MLFKYRSCKKYGKTRFFDHIKNKSATEICGLFHELGFVPPKVYRDRAKIEEEKNRVNDMVDYQRALFETGKARVWGVRNYQELF
jgi:hypothetical protein